MDKFNDINPLQLENMLDISLTFEVSKLYKFKEFNKLHEENIELILLTFDVLKFDKSNDLKLEHP